VAVGEEFGVSIARQTLSRELHSLGYRKLTARPRITPRQRGRSSILKKFPCHRAETAQDKGIERAAIEIWFADEARIGQTNKIIRRRARCMLRSILRMHIRR
jgi:hypothetical protein